MAKKNDAQIVLRVPQELVDEADALAEAMSQPGITMTQTDVFRAAIVRGLEALRKVRR